VPGTPVYDGDGQVRDGAWVAELTGLVDLTGRPSSMRVIARKERPHPGAQLRFTDHDGHRVTCFVTSTRTGRLADVELRHRRPAWSEASAAPRTPGCVAFYRFAHNQLWCEIVALGLRADGLDPDAHSHRQRPPLGAQAPAAAPVLRRRADRPRRPAAAAAPSRPMPWARQITTAITRLQALAPG
jgi:hypothetical protein